MALREPVLYLLISNGLWACKTNIWACNSFSEKHGIFPSIFSSKCTHFISEMMFSFSAPPAHAWVRGSQPSATLLQASLMRLQRCCRYGDGLGGVELWKSLSSKGCVCKGGKTAWKQLSSGSGAGLPHAEPEMRPDLRLPRWKQTYDALGLSLSMSTSVVSYHGSADTRHLAQLFEGLSPKVLEKEIIKENKTRKKGKKKAQ